MFTGIYYPSLIISYVHAICSNVTSSKCFPIIIIPTGGPVLVTFIVMAGCPVESNGATFFFIPTVT